MSTLPAAFALPFHPEQCPQCKNYEPERKHCRALVINLAGGSTPVSFEGQSSRACEMFETNESQRAPAADGSSQPGVPPVPQAAVTCHKCKTINPEDQVRCRSCNADLLPGESIAQHIVYFVAGLALSGVAVFLLYNVLEGNIRIDFFCFQPLFLLFLTVAGIIGGFAKMVTPTRKYERYANRADRHKDINPLQALADITNAIDLAPKGERPKLIKKRQEINTSLGAQREVLRDKLDLTLDPETYKTGASLAGLLLNADADAYAGSMATTERQALLNSGQVKAFGYCKRCHAPVELDARLKCPRHAGVKAVHYALAGEESDGMSKVMREVEQSQAWPRRRRNLAIVILAVALTVYFVVKYGINRPDQGANDPSLPPGVAAMPTSSIRATEYPTTPPSSAAVEEVQLVTFAEHEVSFEYPSNWGVIDESGVETLLQGALKGIEDWEYIGGVYLNSLGDCLDCAQIVVYAVPLSEGFPGWSEEFYESLEQNNQDSMGGRLLFHRPIAMDDYPGWEVIYLGKSGRTKIWDQSLLPEGQDLLVTVSASAHPDRFDEFLPVFKQAFGSLGLYGHWASSAAGNVLGNRARVRAGPGTDFNVLTSLSSGTEFIVLGRNEQGDWIRIELSDGMAGWVSAELVHLPVPIEELPVVPAD
jgi:hypothetical protein